MKLNISLIICLAIGIPLILPKCNGWKLRDLTRKSDKPIGSDRPLKYAFKPIQNRADKWSDRSETISIKERLPIEQNELDDDDDDMEVEDEDMDEEDLVLSQEDQDDNNEQDEDSEDDEDDSLISGDLSNDDIDDIEEIQPNQNIDDEEEPEKETDQKDSDPTEENDLFTEDETDMIEDQSEIESERMNENEEKGADDEEVSEDEKKPEVSEESEKKIEKLPKIKTTSTHHDEELEQPKILSDRSKRLKPVKPKVEENQEEDESSGWIDWIRSTISEFFDIKNTTDSMEVSIDQNETESIDPHSYLNQLTEMWENLELESILNQRPLTTLWSLIESFRDVTIDDAEEQIESFQQQRVEQQDNEPIKIRPPIQLERFEQILLNIPSFVPDYNRIDSIECKRMGQIFHRQARGQKLWALQMMDATAKIPSGLLRGNTNQLGDFDLCTDIRTKVNINENQSVRIKGKYCMANIEIHAIDEELRLPVHLMQGRNFIRSYIKDPAHLLPRFSTIKWGICVPNGCTHTDANEILSDFLHRFNETGVRLFLQIDKDDCYVKSRRHWTALITVNWKILGTIGYFGIFLAVVILASMNDYCSGLRFDMLLAPDKPAITRQENTEREEIMEDNDEPGSESVTMKIFMAFSIKRSVKLLFGTVDDSPDIDGQPVVKCIYGMKALATILLFISFKFLMIGHIPFTNRAHLTEILNSPFSVFIRSPLLYLDAFLLYTGFLSAFKMSHELNLNGYIPWIRRYIGRILRLIPSMIGVILFTGWILELIGNGPQWGSLITPNVNLCKRNIWKNFLFIQNWIPIEDQCSPQLGQQSIEMQLYLLTPLLVWLMHHNVTLGIGFFGVLHAFSAGLRYTDVIDERLSPIIFHGMKLSQIYRTINLSYASTLQRATAYCIGIGLGVMLPQIERTVRLPKAANTVGWLFCTFSFGWCFWSAIPLAHKDYVYEPISMAHYSAWAPIVWSTSLSWIIFICYTCDNQFVNRLMSVWPVQFISKISYQLGIVQYPVFLYMVGTTRSLDSFSFWYCINSLEVTILLMTSIIFTILFDIPMQQIGKIIVNYKSHVSSDEHTDLVDSDRSEDQDNSKMNGILYDESQKDRYSESPEPPSPDVFQTQPENGILHDEVIIKMSENEPNAWDKVKVRSYTPVWKKDDLETNHQFWDGDVDDGNDKNISETNEEDKSDEDKDLAHSDGDVESDVEDSVDLDQSENDNDAGDDTD